jgi:hypothetical protein
MTLQLHDEIKRVAHAIISEYVRSYPADPHTEVLAKFVDRLELTVMKLRRIEGAPAVSAHVLQAQAQMGGDPNAKSPPEGQAPLDGPIVEAPVPQPQSEAENMRWPSGRAPPLRK